MFQGSMVALVTPMLSNGDVDNESLEHLIEFHIDNKTDAFVIAGTTGESATLTEKEHCDLIKTAVTIVNKRVPVIAGTGANSTHEAITLTRCAMLAGADACLLVTPYYNKPTQEGLFLHHREVASAVNIPQILYNVPGRTACDMLPATVGRLSKVPNIIGIKEATGEIDRVGQIHELCGTDFDIYSGDDETSVELILAGAKGSISVTANIEPLAVHEMITAALNNDREKAFIINEKLIPLHQKLFVESNPIPVKWAVIEMGLIKQGIRLPMTNLSEEFHDIVRNAMNSARI
ncbi:MAG: 4-hydroxy-tetrahydrodipicolinate synthase [Methylococcales bacterium]|nr:4-hydroxy-tetrahydrodipicolinate synthase [Methylococcales bacterium]MBT7409944.1 4-hydroxy-tetrahydrodipicolinate synthase [Methylococcales bacterium]